MVAENKTEERSKTENRKEQTDENGKNERQKTKKKERGGGAARTAEDRRHCSPQTKGSAKEEKEGGE